MTANEPAAEVPRPEATTSRRELAVARSLDPARVRAEKRVQRFLDAGLELMESEAGKDFTLQQVVERSGQSLRSFYQYFAGKHELLLALFEESVRTTAAYLRTKVGGEKEPLARLHRFAVEYYALCRPPRSEGSAAKQKVPSPAMAEFAQQLLTDHPKEASLAFVPLVELVTELLDGASEAGAIRSDQNHERVAGILLQAIMFNAFATTISGSTVPPGDEDAEALWDLVLHGLTTD